MATVEIITDGGGSYGVGHIRRSLTLAHAISNRGHAARVSFASDAARTLAPNVPDDKGTADILVIDLPYDGDEFLRQARTTGVKTAGLDYIGSENPDLLIAVIERNAAPGCSNRYAGLDYAIIRPDVMSLAPSFQGSGVIVVIGGGDQRDEGVSIAENLSGRGMDVTLIEGPLVKTQSQDAGAYIRVKDPKNLPQLMADCAWAVTNGGATMMEMMCLGKAVHVIAQTPAETELANIVLQQDGLLGVGIDTLKVPDAKTTRDIGLNARRIVDGNGVNRIIGQLEALL